MKRLLFFLAFFLIPSFAQAQADLLPFFEGQYFDNSGNPVSSGFICTTITGTTTNLATYPTAADAVAGTNANANPVALDSAGRANIFTTTGIYRIVLLNPVGTGSSSCNGAPTGSAIKTVDGVAGFGSLNISGTNNTLAMFTGLHSIGNSILTEQTSNTVSDAGRFRVSSATRVDPTTGTSLDLLYDSSVDQAAIAAANWAGSVPVKTLSIIGNTVAVLAGSSGTPNLASVVPSAVFDWGGISVRGVTYRWPTANGAANSVLTNSDGAGTLTWSAGGGGGGMSCFPTCTTNTIPTFTSASTVADSIISQVATGNNRQVTVSTAAANGSQLQVYNTNTASGFAYAQLLATDGAAGASNNVSVGVTGPAFVGAPLVGSQAYIQVPASAGMFAFTTNLAPWIMGVNNAEVARLTADSNPVLSLGSTTADDQAQIRVQAVKSGLNGQLIEIRNSNITSTTAYASFLATDDAAAGSNNMQMGVTAASFVTSGGVPPQTGFLAAASATTGGIVIQTRSASPISLQVNQVEKLKVTASGVDIRGVAYSWPSSQGGASTTLTNDGSGGLSWSAGSGSSGINGGGTNNFIAKFTPDGTHIGNSMEFDDATTFYVNKTSGGSALILEYAAKNQNNATYSRLENSTAGTLSQSAFIAVSDQANSNMQVGVTSSTFNTANNIPKLAGFLYSGTDNTNGLYVESGAGPITFQPAGTTMGTFKSTGLGIGTTAPANLLHVSTGGATGITTASTGIVVTGGNTTSPRLIFENTGDNAGRKVFAIQGGGSINGGLTINSLNDAGTAYVTQNIMTMLYTGNVGIDTQSPDQLFTVQTNQNAATYADIKNTTAGTTSQAAFYTQSDGASAKTYIGTTSSTYTTSNNLPKLIGYLDSGASNTNGLYIQAEAGNISLIGTLAAYTATVGSTQSTVAFAFNYNVAGDSSTQAGFIAGNSSEFDLCATVGSACDIDWGLNYANKYMSQVIPVRSGSPGASGGTGNYRWYVDSSDGNKLKIVGPLGAVTTVATP